MKRTIFLIAVAFVFAQSCLTTGPPKTTAQCVPRASHLFYGVATDTMDMNGLEIAHVLSGVEIQVFILPFEKTLFDTTDSLGIYAIEYPCGLLPVYQEYMISAKHCDGRMIVRGGIPIAACGPIYRRFDF